MSIKMQCGLAFIEVPAELIEKMSAGDVDAFVRNLIEAGSRMDGSGPHDIEIG